MSTKTMTDEAQIRELIDQWREAVCGKDIEALMEHYSPRMVSYDAWGALKNPIEVYRDHWEQCFAGHAGSIHFEHHELHLSVSDTVAFCYCLIHMSGTLSDGTDHTFWGRGTICFEKIDERWQVTHEHASVPFDPVSGKARTDLEPCE